MLTGERKFIELINIVVLHIFNFDLPGLEPRSFTDTKLKSKMNFNQLRNSEIFQKFTKLQNLTC